MQAEAKQVDASDVKKRLDSVFGSYNQFSELIVKPGFNSPSIYGVAPIPMSPMINCCGSNFGKNPLSSSDCLMEQQPCSSATSSYAPLETVGKERVPTEKVLQSMQSLVSHEPLSKLDCFRNMNCAVKSPPPVPPTIPNSALEKVERRKRIHPTPDPSADGSKRHKREAEVEQRKPAKPATSPPPQPVTIQETKKKEAELFGDLFGDEDSSDTDKSVNHESTTSAKEKPVLKNSAKAIIANKEEVNSSSPRIVLKIPRVSSNSSLSTLESSRKESKSKHKKHKSDKHREDPKKERLDTIGHELPSAPETSSQCGEVKREEDVVPPGVMQEPERRDTDSRLSTADVEQILEQFKHVSPLLSPLHQISPPTRLEDDESEHGCEPQASTSASDQKVPRNCQLNLSDLSPKKWQRLNSKWQSLMNGDQPKTSCQKILSDPKPPAKGEQKIKKEPDLVKTEIVNREENMSNKKSKPALAKEKTEKKESTKPKKEEKMKIPIFRHPENVPMDCASAAIHSKDKPKVQAKVKQEPVIPKEPPTNVLSNPFSKWDLKLDSKSTVPSPKPWTSNDPADRSMPLKKAVLEKVEPDKQTVGHYQKLAKYVKHKGDTEKDRIRKAIFYLESVVYFIMSAHQSLQKPTESGNTEHTILSEVAIFLKSTTFNFIESKTESNHLNHFRARVKSISLLVQSSLTYHLFQIRSLQAQSNFKALTLYEKDPNSAHQQFKATKISGGDSVGGCSNTTTTPSPASSTPSSNRSNSGKETITVPADVYSLLFNQNKILNHLMWAHKMWRDAFTSMSSSNKTFVANLDKLCGELKLDTELKDVAVWLLTSVKWMSKEYEERLKAFSK